MHGKSWTLWACAVLVGSMMAGCGIDAVESSQPARAPVGVVTLEVETIEPRHMLAGRTIASEVSQVRPQVGGVVTGQLFTEGSFVKAGQPLYQIDASLYQAAVDQAHANLALARATLKSTQLRAQRYRELIAVEGVSQQELDDAEAQFEQAKATVAGNEAALATARTQLNHTRVTAPISGRIGRSTITRGALVTASQETALATIQKLDPMHVDLTQSSEAYLALGQELMAHGIAPAVLTVQLQSNDGRVHEQTGTLAFSDIAVDAATGTVMLRASVANPGQTLLPGMYVRAQLGVGPRPALLLPQGAVVRDSSGEASVWIATADGKAERREVTLGQAIGNRWQVAAGLQAGERVIVDGLQSLRAGVDIETVSEL